MVALLIGNCVIFMKAITRPVEAQRDPAALTLDASLLVSFFLGILVAEPTKDAFLPRTPDRQVSPPKKKIWDIYICPRYRRRDNGDEGFNIMTS